MSTKRKVAKTIWVARQIKDSTAWYQDDEYIVFVQKAEPKVREDTGYFDNTAIRRYFPEGLTSLCAPQWHRATGIRLKRGEVAKIKVTLVK